MIEIIEQVDDPYAGMTILEIKAQDDNYEDGIIRTVRDTGDSYDIVQVNGTGLFVDKEGFDSKPKKGDSIRVYGGLGFPFYGIDVAGKEVFYKTPMQRILDRVQWLTDYDKKQRKEFEVEKQKLDEDFESLPDLLKIRIERFRKEDKHFRISSERYEMFCCTEGVKIANFLKSKINESMSKDDIWAVVHEFHENYELSKTVISDEHSGNTFDGACRLAYCLLAKEDC